MDSLDLNWKAVPKSTARCVCVCPPLNNWYGDTSHHNVLIIPTSSCAIPSTTLPPIIMEVENGCIWKVTILLKIHPFFTEPWLWEDPGIVSYQQNYWNLHTAPHHRSNIQSTHRLLAASQPSLQIFRTTLKTLCSPRKEGPATKPGNDSEKTTEKHRFPCLEHQIKH